MTEYLKLLEDYMLESSILLNELCDMLQISQDEQLFKNLLNVQQELSSLCIAEMWKVRMHGQDVAFIGDSYTITVNLININIITMSFFHAYLERMGKDDINKTILFLNYLVQQGKAIQFEPPNAYEYMITYLYIIEGIKVFYL